MKFLEFFHISRSVVFLPLDLNVCHMNLVFACRYGLLLGSREKILAAKWSNINTGLIISLNKSKYLNVVKHQMPPNSQIPSGTSKMDSDHDDGADVLQFVGKKLL